MLSGYVFSLSVLFSVEAHEGEKRGTKYREHALCMDSHESDVLHAEFVVYFMITL